MYTISNGNNPQKRMGTANEFKEDEISYISEAKFETLTNDEIIIEIDKNG